MPQPSLFDDGTDGSANGRSGSFVDNMQLPIHRWFRYSAGFSAEWVRELIHSETQAGRVRVLDPFAGSGTVLLEAEREGAEGLGIESHPFVARIARAKLAWREDIAAFRKLGQLILDTARTKKGRQTGYAALIGKCFPPETLTRLDALRQAIGEHADGSGPYELCWLALVSILRLCSPVGTAQWQYVLPKKSKIKTLEPFQAFEERIELMAADMRSCQFQGQGSCSHMLTSDARTCEGVAEQWADLVITSPPYANNYDYADATRLEMTFLGEINGWGDLQKSIRQRLVRSCTQHVAPFANRTGAILQSSEVAPIAEELKQVCSLLDSVKEKHGGKKPYHAMIAHYFHDLAQVWISLRRVTRPGGPVCFVIGDSAPYGVHVPVERWLGELAIAAGFKGYKFEKLRDRNTKWKNRKHKVPLQEGRLWIEG
ncbi:MAG: DNA methyltransferase [Gemmataceae bacterium]